MQYVKTVREVLHLPSHPLFLLLYIIQILYPQRLNHNDNNHIQQTTNNKINNNNNNSNINSFHLSDRYDQLQLMFFGNFWNFFPVQTICEGEVLQNIKVRKLLT